jgi:hypothetical protein
VGLPFFTFDRWYLLNLDTAEKVKGQFPAENVTESLGAEYAAHWALNRQNAILQFLHGAEDTISFEATLFKETAGFLVDKPHRKVATLKKMVKRDKITGRPPVLQFWIGDSHVSMICVCDSMQIRHEKPTHLGGMHEVHITFNLRKYTPAIPGLISNFDTRYHVARVGDSYEMLCYTEYQTPILGVVIRQRNPSMPLAPKPGAVIKLPSIQGLRTSEIKPISYIFTDANKGDSPQGKRLAQIVAQHSAGRFSKLLKA